MKEKEIDCMKYRKYTHLASVDVEAIIAEKGECVLTIKEAYYDKNVDVSGTKKDGYFISFVEKNVKDMLVNSTNRMKIAEGLRLNTKCSAVESRNIGNWEGLVIELTVDENVKMMGQIVSGIRVKKVVNAEPVDYSEQEKLINNAKTIEELVDVWNLPNFPRTALEHLKNRKKDELDKH